MVDQSTKRARVTKALTLRGATNPPQLSFGNFGASRSNEREAH